LILERKIMPEIEHEQLKVSGASYEDGMSFSNEHYTGVCIIKDERYIEFCVKKKPQGNITKFPIWGGFKRIVHLMRSSFPVMEVLTFIRKGKRIAEVDEEIENYAIPILAFSLIASFLVILPHTLLWVLFWLWGYTVLPTLFHLYCGLLCSSMLFWLMFSMRFKQKESSKYHGAEHMCAQAYEAGLDLTPEILSGFSPYHPRCGTALVTIIGLTVPLLFYLIPIGGFLGLIIKILVFLVAFGLATDVFRLLNLYAPSLLFLGTWLQRFTVRCPERKHMDLAIRTMNILRSCKE
jgi:uncharacterized protein YqhQ